MTVTGKDSVLKPRGGRSYGEDKIQDGLLS